jgi:hypothetical protein
LLAGLPVLASDTAGQKEIAKAHPQITHIFQNGNSDHLAFILNQILTHRNQIESAKIAALNIAKTKYCWEESQKTLLSLVSQALSN